MPNVKCAIGGETIDVTKALWCPHHQFWVCYSHAEKSGMFGTGAERCPQCHTTLVKNK